MNKKLVLAAPFLALLAACGGSSTGNTSVQTLWESPRGTGAGVVRATDGTSNSVALVEDINDAGKYRTFEIVDVVSETLNNDGSYSGEVVVRYADGSTANIIGVFYEKAALYANIQNDSQTYVAGGEQASNMPVGITKTCSIWYATRLDRIHASHGAMTLRRLLNKFLKR